MADMRKAFLGDIIENIDDDTPRLVFADWLEDDGDLARAEFIRIQCKEAAGRLPCPWLAWERGATYTPRETALIAEHGKEWMKEAPKWATERTPKRGIFHRGFIARVTSTGRNWQKGVAALYRRVPIEALQLGKMNDSLLSALSARPKFGYLRLLGLWTNGCSPASLAQFFASADLHRVVTLECTLPSRGIEHLNALLASDRLGGVRSLVLSGGLFGVERFTSLAASGLAPRLRSLAIDATRLSGAAAMAFGRSRNFSELEELSMRARNLEDEGVIVLAGSPFLGKLRRLHLGSSAFLDESVVQALTTSPYLTRLTDLALDYLGARPETISLIAESESMIHLRRLRVNKDAKCHRILKRLAERRRERGIE